MARFVNTFDFYHHKFKFGHLFSSPVKLWKDFNLKFRWKFDHGFTNHGYLHCVILKPLYSFKVKRVHKVKDQFLICDLPNIQKTIWNWPEQPKLATKFDKQQGKQHHTHHILMLLLMLIITVLQVLLCRRS